MIKRKAYKTLIQMYMEGLPLINPKGDRRYSELREITKKLKSFGMISDNNKHLLNLTT